MARNQGKRLPPVKIEGDRNGLAALETIRGYTPINSTYSLDAVKAAHEELQGLLSAEAQSQVQAQAARAKLVAKEWEFHNLMLGVKEQVIAQFGKDSPEVEALGLKRKSDYKLPRRKSKTGGATA